MSEKTVSEAAIASLRSHRWPGNVRELAHAVERAMILSDGPILAAADFHITQAAGHAGAASLQLEENERRLVVHALELAGDNISHAAEALGITRAALYRRIDKFGL